MAAGFIDIHPHIISEDLVRYPRVPLFGVQSDWSKERPANIEGLVAAMDEAGVQKAAIVQSSTCYGFDNSYVVDAIAKYPGRFTAVGSVDMCDAAAPATIAQWARRGVNGLRLFTGGSTAAFDTSGLDDARSFPAWSACAELNLAVAIQTDPTGLAQVAGLAKRFPTVRIVLDHLGRPEITDGPPYKRAVSLFALAAFENVFFKVTPRTFGDAKKGQSTSEAFFPRLVEVFGSNRLAWGSNFPASEGKLSALLEVGKKSLACLSAEDQSWIFARTAQRLYPALA
jgi:predicted TIM-barrel fold metal-dependent hydrolase